MAYVAPATRTTGTLITAAIWNQDVSANPIALYARDALLLLKANSGTTTSAVAENVDTYAMASQLTAKDSLQIFIALSELTQAAANVRLYNATDGVTLTALAEDPFLAGVSVGILAMIRQQQHAATAVSSLSIAPTANEVQGFTATFTTNWTGAWTLALRHDGVTAGGTLRWSWAVYRVVGQ